MGNNANLSEHLKRCTARLLANATGATGTGFFVAPGYLLTCTHVVVSPAPQSTLVTVTWEGKEYPATIEKLTNDDYPDLALLHITNAPDHPCVYLFPNIFPGDSLWTFGYPTSYPGGDPASFTCEGETGGVENLIKFKEGEVRPGLSGSPLLNERTAAVCGIVKLTRGSGSAMGGRALPVSRILHEFPELAKWQTEFHTQNKQWASNVTLQQRQLNGLNKLGPPTGKEAVEIFFSYHDNDADVRIFERLEKQLTLLRRAKTIKDWHKGKLTFSQDVEKETLKHLNSAQIICLLISPDYLADDKLYDTHVERAMERRADEKTIVIPILVRKTNDLESASFGALMAIPRNRRPMNQWADLDEVSMQVAKEIGDLAKALYGPTS